MPPKPSAPRGMNQAERKQMASRFAVAEAACQAADQVLGRLALNDDAQARWRTMQVYWRKIRQGKVLGAADFNLAADVCRSARRVLQAMEPTLRFADPRLQALLTQLDAMAQAYQEVTGKPLYL